MKVLFSLVFLMTSSAQAEPFSQLSLGSHLTFLKDVRLPPRESTFAVKVSGDRSHCWLHFEPDERTRIIKAGRIFRISTIEPHSDHQGLRTLIAKLGSGNVWWTPLEIRCEDVEIDKINALYRDVIHLTRHTPWHL